jgi:limonene-1,2-epoxide hydrolase
MSDSEQLVREFVGAWSRLDADELADYFAEDGVYHNVMLDPVEGRDAIREFIAGFAADWTDTEWEIRNLASDGDVVFAERVDRIETEDGDVDLPVVGVFEVEDGEIAAWRDYFDMGTFVEGME